MKTPAQVIAGYVTGFEGGLSLQAADNGNWYDPARFRAGQPQRRSCGTLVGSMRGVTAYALVAYRQFCGWPTGKARAVSHGDMAAIDAKTATAIGVALYVNQPGLANLVWNRVTAAVLDRCWLAGTGSTIKRLQRLIGAQADGVIAANGETVRLYAVWLARLGEEAAARAWCDLRHAWDREIATNGGPSDPDRLFLSGWNRRSDSFLPGTPWWQAW